MPMQRLGKGRIILKDQSVITADAGLSLVAASKGSISRIKAIDVTAPLIATETSTKITFSLPYDYVIKADFMAEKEALCTAFDAALREQAKACKNNVDKMSTNIQTLRHWCDTLEGDTEVIRMSIDKLEARMVAEEEKRRISDNYMQHHLLEQIRLKEQLLSDKLAIIDRKVDLGRHITYWLFGAVVASGLMYAIFV